LTLLGTVGRGLERICAAAVRVAGLSARFGHQPLRPAETHCGRAMGTAFSVTVSGRRAPDGARIRAEIERTLERIEGLMSAYRSDSEIGRFNLAAGSDWMPVSPVTARVVREAIEIGRRSGGAYDVTVGALVNLWGFGPERRPPIPPSPQEVAGARSRTGLERIEVRDSPPAIRKTLPQLRLDLAGIAKGFGVDQVGETLERLGIGDYCAEVGGEVLTHGRRARGKPWRVAVEMPEASLRTLQRVVSLSGLAMATSGDYRQYFEEYGIRYSHILDPRTGYPIRHDLASVTVLDRTCARADAWATALLVAGPDEGPRLAEREDLAALFIVRKGLGYGERCTTGFQALAKE